MKDMQDRITVLEKSISTTQHSLSVCFDGKLVATVANSYRGDPFTSGRPIHGNHRDWMDQSAEQAAPWLKVWFVQRYLKFSNAPVCSVLQHRAQYDAELAYQMMDDRARSESPQVNERERERV